MSRLPFELFLALRYFRPKGTYVSVITLIAIIGVMLAVGMLIIVIAVMTGFDKELRDKILGFNAHAKIYSRSGPMRDYVQVMKTVRTNAEVKGVSPFILGPIMIETQPRDGSAPLVGAPYVRGVDAETESSISVLPSKVVSGKFDLEGRAVLVGSEMAQNMGLMVGDHVAIYSTRNLHKMKQTRGTTNEMAFLPDDYTVRGIFDVGHFEYNSTIIATSLENAQELYDLDGYVHGIMVMLKDPFKAAQFRSDIYPALGPDYKVSLWTEENSVILNALVVEKKAMFLVLFVVMVVAAFGIMGTLIAFVFQKIRDIGVLKAIGATNGQIAWLFLSQSMMVGVVGVASGFVFGRTLLAFRNEFLHFMNHLTGSELFPASLYSFNELPALIIPGDIAMICGSAMLLCMLAGVLPALKAASLHPVEALRHE